MGDVVSEVSMRLAVRYQAHAQGEGLGAVDGGNTALCAKAQVMRVNNGRGARAPASDGLGLHFGRGNAA
jgi:hypothetical protein